MRSLPTELHRLSDQLAICQAYDPSVKADLFSTALLTDSGVLLIDPFAIDAETLAGLTSGGEVAGVIVTNENHVRASAAVAQQFSAKIYANVAAGVSGATPIDNLRVADLSVVEIAGAPAGEIALYSQRERGTLIVGDALINFGSHGFTMLPPKYCTDAHLMRRSLQQLLDFDFERILFAHGAPILAHARERLTSLLGQAS